MSAPLLRSPRVAFPSRDASVAQASSPTRSLPSGGGMPGNGGGGATGIDSQKMMPGAPNSCNTSSFPPRSPPAPLRVPQFPQSASGCAESWGCRGGGGWGEECKKHTHKAQHLSLYIHKYIYIIYILAQCLFSGTLVWQSMHLVRKCAIQLPTWSLC